MSEMTTAATVELAAPTSVGRGRMLFGVLFGLGVLYVASNLVSDLSEVRVAGALPYLLLVLALFVALGFEFVNGFHDTGHAAATVIYTHSLESPVADALPGFWNFLG